MAHNDIAIEVDHVWKKFRRGEFHDSLRDLIPAMTRRMLGHGIKGRDLGQQEFWALHDVSFQVRRGESLGIIGPNGAGKSTMLKLLSRIIRPNRGRYRVNGRLSALIEVGAGFHADLTGRENILLNGTIMGMSRREILAKADQIIDFAGIADAIDTPVKRYSSGMTARLGFAVAAHLDPEVLLVDEVLSVGDARFRAKCIRHMKELINSDVTVIFISHILDQVRALCPNTVVLDHGKVIYHGETDGAIRTYIDVLSQGTDEQPDSPAEAYIANVCFRDDRDQSVLQWPSRRPGVVDFDLVLRHRCEHLAVLINVASVGGTYLGTANTKRDGIELPAEPGTYPMRFTLDPMLLADGDYQFEFKIQQGPGQERCVWTMTQPRAISVRGAGTAGSVINCDGRWQLRVKSMTPHAAEVREPVHPA